MFGLDVLNVSEVHEGIRAAGIADGSREAAIVKRVWDVTRGDPVKVRYVLTDWKAGTLTPEMLASADAQLPSYEENEIIAAAEDKRSYVVLSILALARGPL